jgi:hypothetical protein
MTEQTDTALIAAQLADLTHTVEEIAKQLRTVLERADSQQTRADVHRSASTSRRASWPR